MKRVSKRKLLLFFGDLVIIFVTMNLAYLIRFSGIIKFTSFERYFVNWVVISISFIFSFYVLDLYRIKFRVFSGQQIFLYLLSYVSIFFLIMVFFYLFPFRLGRGLFLINLILAFIPLLLWRLLFSRFLRLALPPSHILIVGNGNGTRNLYRMLSSNPEFKVVRLMRPQKDIRSKIL